MDKLKMHSPDLSQENTAKIRDLFPGCVTEARDEATGQLRLAVDFDQLRQELSGHIVEGPQERYRLDWPGKREALALANAPIARTLRPAQNESSDFDTTNNLLIEGDNLDALKLIQEAYLGKVKIIYIDPPYNTGNDYVYEDDFAEHSHEYLIRSAQSDDSGQRLVSNPTTNGRFHSDWLSFIYPRLKRARDLLCESGVIFISIDDGELDNLKKICDEIFGGENFKSKVVWQKRYTRSNNTVDFTTVAENILVYARSEDFVVNLLERSDEADARYTNPDNDARGPWKGASFLNPARPEERPNLCYPITNPNTGAVTLPSRNAWRRSKAEFQKLQAENLLYWGADGRSNIPSIKMFLSGARGLTPMNFWDHKFAGNTDDGSRDFHDLIPERVFENPKPVQLIERVIEHGCGPNDIVLDFFAGSGTTAHAVMKKNAEDGGNRRFILVQIPEQVDARSEAQRKGYHSIAEITKERVRRAGKKVLQGECNPDWNRDVGFRVLKIDSSNMKDVFYRPDQIDQNDLLAAVDNIKPDRSAEDLLFQVLVDWGVDLTLSIRRETVQDKTVFFVDGNALVACFETGVTEELVKELAGREPLRVVFRDNGFVSDAVKINVEQVFRQLSPGTDVKSL
ncbi:site-specific DNA-methyltransferase [Bosea sp. 2KB_26]|uniref:site-specific DNA-methyltransferase n=1 Tax=Bosea sp. 2KB_26 TaxID=3237475 RepID=UPI003F8E6DE5